MPLRHGSGEDGSFESSEKRTTGLLVGEHDVPLTGVVIDVKARGTASTVTVSQRYFNRETVTVEAVYSFPLEESAAVCGFEVEIDDRCIVGVIEGAEKAFEEYDAAMARGDGAYLLDQDRPNLFTASVGNLLPGQAAVVRLSYVAPLDRFGDQVRLKIPTTVAPRYIPPEKLKTMDPAELAHLAPPTVMGDVPYGLTLGIDFEGWSDVTSVECPSHPVQVQMSGRRARVDLAGSDIQLDQDVVVTFSMAAQAVTNALVAEDEQGDTVIMLDLAPAVEDRRKAAEVIFVLDRSGSMMHSSIDAARNALLLCLRSLQEGDSFNVVGFGSTYEKLFAESRAFDQNSLDEATKAVKAVDADLGGTEILKPLQDVLGGRRGELPLRVLLLTDGEVGNEDEVIALASRHADNATIFTLGIGYGASDELVRGLARASGGWAEFVHPNERVEPKVMRQMARVGAGEPGDVTIDWGGLEPDLVAPADLPPLFPGSTLTVYGRVPKDKAMRLAQPRAGRGARRRAEDRAGRDASAGHSRSRGRRGGPDDLAAVRARGDPRPRAGPRRDLRGARLSAGLAQGRQGEGGDRRARHALLAHVVPDQLRGGRGAQRRGARRGRRSRVAPRPGRAAQGLARHLERLSMFTSMMAAAPSPAGGRAHRAMGFSPLAPMAN